MGLYFGATSGDVFGSGDAGASWFTRPRAARAGELGPGRLVEPKIRHLPGVSEGGLIMGPWERSSRSRSTGTGGAPSSP